MPGGAAGSKSRREALGGLLRWAAFGGMAGIWAGLAARDENGPAKGRCPGAAACHRCRALADCGLPPALATKKQQRR